MWCFSRSKMYEWDCWVLVNGSISTPYEPLVKQALRRVPHQSIQRNVVSTARLKSLKSRLPSNVTTPFFAMLYFCLWFISLLFVYSTISYDRSWFNCCSSWWNCFSPFRMFVLHFKKPICVYWLVFYWLVRHDPARFSTFFSNRIVFFFFFLKKTFQYYFGKLNLFFSYIF